MVTDPEVITEADVADEDFSTDVCGECEQRMELRFLVWQRANEDYLCRPCIDSLEGN